MTPIETLMLKAASDASFRALAKADPHRALKGAGLEIPKGATITVHENDLHTIHVVLPRQGEMTAPNPHVQKVFDKAWADAQFKAKLLKDPMQAIKEATGAQLPASLKILAYENSDREVHFSLPYVPPKAGELSDADLELVAGGKGETCKMNDVIFGPITAMFMPGLVSSTR
jgi:hypothetical protein